MIVISLSTASIAGRGTRGQIKKTDLIPPPHDRFIVGFWIVWRRPSPLQAPDRYGVNSLLVRTLALRF